MRLGLVGYGVGGRYFHAPFVVAAQGVELAGVVTRSPDRRAELAADLPGVPAYDSLADLLAAGVDAVTITTPPHTRRTLVLQAIAAVGVLVYSFVVAWIIGFAIEKTIGFRIKNEDELAGVDTVVHGEEGYAIADV